MKAMLQRILILLTLLKIYLSLGVIQPTADIKLSVLNYGSPTVIRFQFQLTTKLLKTNYMFVTFPTQWKTVTPRRCIFGKTGGSMPNLIATCTKNPLINQLYVQFSEDLEVENSKGYILIIELEENVPTVLKAQMSGIFKFETHSTTEASSNVFDKNPVFGMVPISTPKQNFDLVIKSFKSLTTGTENLANAENDLLIQVSITTTTRTNARIKVFVQFPWKFSSAASTRTSKLQVSADNDFPEASLIPPVISKIDIIADNEFDVIFKSPLVKGQIFMLSIPKIKNPGFKATSGLYLYLMETNSNSYVAGYQKKEFFSVNQYIIDVNLTHPNGIPMGTAPMNYYRGKYQGFKLSFIPPQALPINSIIKISLGDDNQPVKGSLYIQIKTDLTATATDLQTRPKFLITYQLYRTDEIIVTITGNEIPASHVVHLIFRVILTATKDSIKPTLSIWTEPEKFTNEDPLYYGDTTADIFTTTQNLVRYWNQNGQVSLQGLVNPIDNSGSAVTLEFNLTTKSNDAQLGSRLEVYLPKVITAHANWNIASSCTTTGNASSAFGTFSNCTIVTNSQYTIITLPSGAANNYFFSDPTAPGADNATTTEEQYYNINGTVLGVPFGLCTELCPFDNIMVTIQNLVIATDGVSNFAENMYDIFLRLYSSDSATSGTIDWVGNLVISSQLTKFTEMSMSFGQKMTPNTDTRSNNSRETDTRSVYRPSWVHIISSTKSGPAVTTSTDEKKLITIFAKDSFQKLLYQEDILGTTTAPLTGEITYPCSANLNDFKCIFVEGAQTSRTTYVALQYFLDYDRIHIIFTKDNGTESDGWHVIIPTLILADSQEFYALTGSYNTITEEISYQGAIGNQIFTGTIQGFPMDSAFTTDLNLVFQDNTNAGKKMDLTTKIRTLETHLGNTGSNMAAALVLMTDWELWIKGISGLDDNDPNTETVGKNIPLTLSFKDFYGTTRYFTYIPLINAAHMNIAGGVSLILRSVFMPYSHDINSYYLYTLNNDGIASTFYNEMNLGQNFLTVATIIDPTFKCDKQYVNLFNQRCELEFTPNQMIQSNGILSIKVNNGYIATDKCKLEYAVADSSQPVIDTYTCSTTNDTLQIFLNHNYRLPELTKYKITFWGLDTDRMVQATDFFPTVTIEIRDAANIFVIEQNSIRNFKIAQDGPVEQILIKSMVYEQMNAKTVTTLVLEFELPRDLYPNEEILYRLGIDLESANLGNQRILMTLYNSQDIQLDVTFSQTEEIVSIIWDQVAYPVMFTKGIYKIRINGLITPTSHKNGVMSIFFRRMYDKAIVLKTDPTSVSLSFTFSEHPLTEFYVSGTEYFTEGLLGSISFKIITQKTLIDPQNKIFFFFPTIFSPTLTNSPELLTCKINSIKIPCRTSMQYPYRLELYNSPIFIPQGASFVLTIYGLQIPDYSSMSENTALTGYIGISSWNGFSYGNYYPEQGEFNLPQIKSFNAEHQFISLFDLQISDLTLRASVQYTVDLDFDTGPSQLPLDSQIFISFPEAYTLLQFFTDPLKTKIMSKNTVTNETVVIDTGECVISGQTLIYKVNQAEGIVIEANERMLLIIQELPNPQTAQELNPNELQIKVFSKLDELLYISNSQVNFAEPITFPALKNTFKINKQQPIYVTAGTYTDFMDIKYSEGPRFLSDVQLTLSSQAFNVVPNKVDFTRGDTQGQFKIGADPNLFLQGFPIFIQKQEALGRNEFQNYDNLKGFITYEPVMISPPKTIKVAYGGTSLLQQIILKKRPYNDIELLFFIDFNKFGEDIMIDSEFSSPTIKFDYNSYLGNIQVYCEGSIPFEDYAKLKSQIEIQIHGTNDNSYQLKTNIIKLEIVKMDNIPPVITFDVPKDKIQKVEAMVKIETNQPGLFFYQMGNVGWAKMSYRELKEKIVNNSYIEVDEGILSDVRRTGMIIIENKSYKKVFDSLQTETNYFLSGYLVQQFKVVSNATEVNFTTLENAAMRKIAFKFSEPVTLDTLNYLLCFLADMIITPRYQIFTSDGFYCSVSVEPDVFEMKYSGMSETTFQLATNLYFQSNQEYEADPAMTLLESFIPTSSRKPTKEFYTLGNASDIGYLANVTHMLTFQEKIAKMGKEPLEVPNVRNLTYKLEIEEISGISTTEDASQSQSNDPSQSPQSDIVSSKSPTTRVKLTLDKIILSGDGKFFYIIEKSHVYYEDPDDPGFWQPKVVFSSQVPSPEQIYGCQNWENTTKEICGKIVITNNQVGKIDIEGIEDKYIYQMYYVTANEFPLSNVFTQNVSNLQINVFSLESVVFVMKMWWLVLLGIICYFAGV